MEAKRLKPVSFASRGSNGFFDEVISRVDTYFEEKELSPYANNGMWLKTAVCFPSILFLTF